MLSAVTNQLSLPPTKHRQITLDTFIAAQEQESSFRNKLRTCTASPLHPNLQPASVQRRERVCQPVCLPLDWMTVVFKVLCCKIKYVLFFVFLMYILFVWKSIRLAKKFFWVFPWKNSNTGQANALNLLQHSTIQPITSLGNLGQLRWTYGQVGLTDKRTLRAELICMSETYCIQGNE